jgi:hypothetical protein
MAYLVDFLGIDPIAGVWGVLKNPAGNFYDPKTRSSEGRPRIGACPGLRSGIRGRLIKSDGQNRMKPRGYVSV